MIEFSARRLARRSSLAIALIMGGVAPGHAQSAPTIPEIQGSSHISPFAGRSVVGVEGVVTGIVTTG